MRALLASGRCAGADITIFDPEKDPDGAFAERIVAMLADVFAR